MPTLEAIVTIFLSSCHGYQAAALLEIERLDGFVLYGSKSRYYLLCMRLMIHFGNRMGEAILIRVLETKVKDVGLEGMKIIWVVGSMVVLFFPDLESR
ncbi:hypothetical protein V6N12_028873 [Hibiscus sabdariffa]|uniref:Uncharacterized protein n=1 Tax=Hibiscus sabdariffa TaxID=183260 RepID=A0ABR2F741_9ROSI